MIQEKEFSVDGQDYKLTTLGAIEGRKIWLRLIHLLAGSLKALGEAPKLDDAAIAQSLGQLIENVDEATIEMLCAAYGKTCRYRNGEKWPLLEPAIFDVHFSGRYVAMSQWLVQCTLLNFANFFDGMSLGQIVERVVAAGETVKAKRGIGATTAAAATTRTSTGSSGGS